LPSASAQAEGEIDPACPPIRVTNHSYGPISTDEARTSFDPDSATLRLQRPLIAQDVTPVWAAGNDGGDGSVARTNPAGMDPTPGVLMVATYNDGNAGSRDNQLCAMTHKDYGRMTHSMLRPSPLRAPQPTHGDTYMRPLPSRRAARRRVAVLGAVALTAPLLTFTTAVAAPPQSLPATQATAAAEPPSVVGDPEGLTMENSFVSAVGWVKPGETYPSRIILENASDQPASNVKVVVDNAAGMTFTKALPTGAAGSGGTATVEPDQVVWTVGTVPAATQAQEATETEPAVERQPGTRSLVLESKAATLAEDPEIVWKNISSNATLTFDGGAGGLVARSHGPKVIPPNEKYDTARFGDRPFPVVPVEYTDRSFQVENAGARADEVINSRELPGSTFNLFQEMSYGQLHPQGAVPSVGIESAGFPEGMAEKFTNAQPAGTCTGVTAADTGTIGTVPAERIVNGNYQLPGQTEYYGRDKYGSGLVGAVAGVGAIFDIDGGCGPTAKSVYDAAAIADPEIDYSDFDTDKDGVVDFFMMIFAGCGGNGSSQLAAAICDGHEAEGSYDNIWPHSSSLEFTYVDEETGLTGYISDDQLKNLEGQPLWYVDESRGATTTTDTGDHLKVFVRVGPYNVNPETSLVAASVISHEYGHSLGLPDFYSLGSRDTYGDWNLMATDKSQFMDIFSRQEMGWVVPEVLEESRTVEGWRDGKLDTQRIVWQRPDGTPYTLDASDQGIHNGRSYVAKLPGRTLLSEDQLEENNGKKVWWSVAGNDFGCPPNGGHNLDIALNQALEDVAPGTELTATFSSRWDIEWDYDYGFVLSGQKEGNAVVYSSNASENGYTTPASQNPNANQCQSTYGNGITGTSGSYAEGRQDVDRVAGNYPEPVWLEDSYDISELVSADGGGVEGAVLRFTYATDAGLARQGWFIDNLVIKAGDEVVYERDFETEGGPDEPSVFNGGCKDRLTTASQCTPGWSYIEAGVEAEADHAYYLEMRDRSGFDNNGRGQNDRAEIAFEPGLSLVYTDEAHGYGNVGTDNPPAQSPLDSVPTPDDNTPDLSDAGFQDVEGRNAFSDSAEDPHIDNYRDPTREDNDKSNADESGLWVFDYNCLGFTVTSMTGEHTTSDDSPGDLTGNVEFTIGAGCGEFDYGYLQAEAPKAVARASDDACPEGQVPGSGRTDVDGNTHEKAIDCIIWWAISNGTTATQYDPELEVTREQMASFVARLIEQSGGDLPDNPPSQFSDRATPVHQENIDKLAAAGIVSGKTDGSYRPHESVTRGQMAKFLVNAYEHVSENSLSADGDFFADDNGTTHEENINKSASAGFTNGRPSGGYEPAAPVRRDQMASFLARTLDLLVEEGTTEPEA
jgi:M6 family metalloprotease-like protein